MSNMADEFNGITVNNQALTPELLGADPDEVAKRESILGDRKSHIINIRKSKRKIIPDKDKHQRPRATYGSKAPSKVRYLTKAEIEQKGGYGMHLMKLKEIDGKPDRKGNDRPWRYKDLVTAEKIYIGYSENGFARMTTNELVEVTGIDNLQSLRPMLGNMVRLGMLLAEEWEGISKKYSVVSVHKGIGHKAWRDLLNVGVRKVRADRKKAKADGAKVVKGDGKAPVNVIAIGEDELLANRIKAAVCDINIFINKAEDLNMHVQLEIHGVTGARKDRISCRITKEY